MPEIVLEAQVGRQTGTRASKRLRREGMVPGIIYGHGTEPRHLSLPGHDVLLALRTANVLIRLEGLPGGAQLALPKAVQRDPIRGSVQHVDLLVVRRGEKVTVDVPVMVNGEVAPGGLLDQQLVQVSVEAEATHIPPSIEVDISGMEVGTAVHAADLVLPRGVTLAEDPELLVLHVLAAPTAEQLEAEIGVPEAEAEAAAPAAAGAAAEAAGEAAAEGAADSGRAGPAEESA